MSFDIQGARKEGYSDAEIATYLATENKFDIEGARKEGYSDTEILDYFKPEPVKPGFDVSKAMEGAATANESAIKGVFAKAAEPIPLVSKPNIDVDTLLTRGPEEYGNIPGTPVNIMDVKPVDEYPTGIKRHLVPEGPAKPQPEPEQTFIQAREPNQTYLEPAIPEKKPERTFAIEKPPEIGDQFKYEAKRQLDIVRGGMNRNLSQTDAMMAGFGRLIEKAGGGDYGKWLTQQYTKLSTEDEEVARAMQQDPRTGIELANQKIMETAISFLNPQLLLMGSPPAFGAAAALTAYGKGETLPKSVITGLESGLVAGAFGRAHGQGKLRGGATLGAMGAVEAVGQGAPLGQIAENAAMQSVFGVMAGAGLGPAGKKVYQDNVARVGHAKAIDMARQIEQTPGIEAQRERAGQVVGLEPGFSETSPPPRPPNPVRDKVKEDVRTILNEVVNERQTQAPPVTAAPVKPTEPPLAAPETTPAVPSTGQAVEGGIEVKGPVPEPYDAFKKRLGDQLYETTGKFMGQPTTNTVHYRQMFETLPKDEAQSLLNEVKKYEQFHPDVIESFQGLIDKKKPADQPSVETVTPPSPVAQAAPKEPWEMTKDSFIKRGVDDAIAEIEGEARSLTESTDKTFLADIKKGDYSFFEQRHFDEVFDALKRGDKVPPEVLKDYPELAKAQPAPVVAEKATTEAQAPVLRDESLNEGAQPTKTKPIDVNIPIGTAYLKDTDLPKYQQQLKSAIQNAHQSLYDTDALIKGGHYDGTFPIPRKGGLIAAKKSEMYRTDEEYRGKVDTAIESAVESIKQSNKYLNLLSGFDVTGEFGVKYSIAPEKVRAGYSVNVARAWHMEAKSKYPNTSNLGDIAVREVLQNSIDATLDALDKRQITEGKIDITTKEDGKGYTVDDNGIGMSDVDINDKLLSLHSTGKDVKGRTGGFGIAKAVIFGPHESATWDLHTRDNHFTNQMAQDREIVDTTDHRQGTRIDVSTDQSIISYQAKQYVETTETPKNISVTFNDKPVVYPFKGMRGKRETVVIDDHTTLEIQYFPKSPEGYNKVQITRLVDKQTNSKLTQGIQRLWGDGFIGTMLVDVKTDLTPGMNGYPLTDSRMELKYDAGRRMQELIEKYSVDKASAQRAGVESKVQRGKYYVAWQKKIPEIEASKGYQDVLKAIDDVLKKTEHYGDITHTPLGDMDIKIDVGYTGPRTITEGQAKFLAAYEAVARMYAIRIPGGKVTQFYALLSKTIDGSRVAGEHGEGGKWGLNYLVMDKTALASPLEYAFYLHDLATHELTHTNFNKHDEDFTSALGTNQRAVSHLFGDTLRIAEAVVGKTSGLRTATERIVEVPVPFETIVEKEVIKYFTPEQLKFVEENIEKGAANGKPELYYPSDERQIGLPEGRGDTGRTALGGEKGGAEFRGGNELPGTQGHDQTGGGHLESAETGVSTEPVKKPTPLKLKEPEAVPEKPKPTPLKLKEKPIIAETTPEGDTVISVKPEPKGITLKEQKTYLLAEIDKAIEGAVDTGMTLMKDVKAGEDLAEKAANDPAFAARMKKFQEDEVSGTTQVTIEVPDDGKFRVNNNRPALLEFRKAVNTMKLTEKPAGASTKESYTSGRVTSPDVEYYNEYKPRKKQIDFGKEIIVADDGFVTNKEIIIKTDKLKGKKISEAEPNVNAAIKGIVTATTNEPARIAGIFKPMGDTDVLVHVITDSGKTLLADPDYLDMIYTEHPKASIGVSSNGDVMVFKDSKGNTVAALMRKLPGDKTIDPDTVFADRIAELKGEKATGQGDTASFNPEKGFRRPTEKPETGEPVRRSDIIKFLAEKLDVPIRFGRFRAQALGIFKVKPEVVRTKYANDVEVAAHEIGHALNKFLWGMKGKQLNTDPLNAFGDELLPIATKPRAGQPPVQEGFAEFIRRYITNEAAAREVAPRFYEFFEKELDMKSPDAKEIFLEARKQFDRWIKQSATQRILGQISTGEKATNPVSWKFVYTKIVDELHPLEKIVAEISKGDKIETGKDPYKLARLMAGLSGKAEAFLEHKTFGFKDYQWKNKSLKDILAPVSDDINPLKAYMTAKRALEKHNQGIDTGISRDDAKQVIQEFGHLEPIAKEVRQYQDDVFQYLIDSGVVGEKDALAMRKLNQEYFPFYRVMETGKSGPGSGEGLEASNPIHQMKGSHRDIIDPFESIIRNTYVFIEAAERNAVIKSLVDLANKYEGSGKFVEKIPVPMQRVVIKEPELLGILQRFGKWTETTKYKETQQTVGEKITQIGAGGEEVEGASGRTGALMEAQAMEALKSRGRSEGEARQIIERIKKAPTAEIRTKIIERTIEKIAVSETVKEFGLEIPGHIVEIFRPSAFVPKKNVISYWKNGERQLYQVDPDIAGVVKALDRESTNILMKLLSYPARWLRAGATLTPEFIVRNPLRDQFSAFNYSEYGYLPGIDLGKGIAHMVKADDIYWKFKIGGGEHSMLVSLDREFSQMKWEDVLRKKNALNIAGSIIKNPLRAFQILSELTEEGTRIGEFSKGLAKEGMTKEGIQTSAFSSREVTLDFARKGTYGKVINKLVAFWNANVQGTDKMIRSFKDHPERTLIKVLASITIPSIMLYMANRDDPRWKEIPAWQKNLFWIVMTDKHIYRIPKPFELGIIFGSFPERILEAIDNKDPKVLNKLWQSMVQGALPGIIPNFALPLAENWANKSWFMNRPIVSQSREGMKPAYQYQPYTTELAKSLGKKIESLSGGTGYSPAKMENLIRGWTGGMGTYALQIADWTLRKAHILPDPVKPLSALSDWPVFKAFVVRYPAADAESIRVFYDNYKKNSELKRTVIGLTKKEFKSEEAAALLDSEKYNNMDKAYITISKQQKFIQTIYQMPSLTPEEKKKLIDTTYLQMIFVAQTANKFFKQGAK